ncbi:TerD family protein [Nakamurella sp. GG22]
MARRSGVVAALVRMQREAERQRARQAREAAKSQRAAATARTRAAVNDQKTRARMYTEDRTREAAEDTAQLEGQVKALQSVLSATLRVDDYLDLEALKQPPPNPVFDPLAFGTPPSPPREGDFAVEGPSALGRVFAASKHAARAEQRQAEYQQALHGYRAAAQQHAQRLEEAHRRHEAEVNRQMYEHRQHVEAISALQSGLAVRQPAAVVAYLDLVLEAAEYPDGFPHSWRLGYAAASGHLDIEYNLPGLDVVPNVKGYKYVKGTDTITPSARPATQIRSIYAEVLRQTALRVVQEVLEADRGGAVRTVVFNGYVNDTDPATGREVRRCLIALATSRERFLQIDLARVNTVDCLNHLEARISKDPSRLQAVEPIELTGSLEADYTQDTDSDPEPLPRPAGPVVTNEVVSPAQTAEQQELVAGQNVPLGESRLQLTLLANNADLSVLLVGASGRVDRDEDFVFYNNPRSAHGAVTLTGNSASVATDLLPQHCERLILVVSAGGDASVANVTAVLHQPDSGIDFRFRPADATGVSALVWGELYLRNGKWRLRAVGQGWSDGLAGLARDYGVNVD